MNFSITKLDRRHAWHQHFPYMVEFHRRKSWDHKLSGGVLEFDQARKWFNNTYGWSQDIETRDEMIKAVSQLQKQNQHWDLEQLNSNWAYSIRYQEYRIYVSEIALTMFKLKWAHNENI